MAPVLLGEETLNQPEYKMRYGIEHNSKSKHGAKGSVYRGFCAFAMLMVLAAAAQSEESEQENGAAETDGDTLSDNRFATTVQIGTENIDIGKNRKNYPYVRFEFYNRGAFRKESPADIQKARECNAGSTDKNAAFKVLDRYARGKSKSWGFDRNDIVFDLKFSGEESGDESMQAVTSTEALSAGLTWYTPFLVNDYSDSVWTKEVGFVAKLRSDFLTENVTVVDDDGNESLGNDFRRSYGYGIRAAIWNHDDTDFGGPDYYFDIMKADVEDLSSDWEIDGRFRIFNTRFFGFANARFGDDQVGDDVVTYGFYAQASWDEVSKFLGSAFLKTGESND